MAAKRTRQIIAIGGGGFEVANAPLNDYVLGRAARARPSICFIGTATGDADPYLTRFYATFSKLDCRPSHLPFFGRTPNLRDLLLSQDVIYVGGGNTKSMLAVWREWNLPAILRQAWQSGTVLAGVSAGAICWFQTGVTDSWADRLRLLPCLGWLPGACCPHYDGEPERRPAVHKFLQTGALPRVLAIEDGAAAHFIDRDLVRVVSARPSSGAFQVSLRRGEVVEEVLPVTRLKGSR